MIEFTPLILTIDRSGCMRDVNLVTAGFVVALGGKVDELKNEWSSGDDTAASGEKISADNVFENGGFPRRLRADDDLFQVSQHLSWVE